MNGSLHHLSVLAQRHGRVVFDLRGNCRVLYGIAVPVRHERAAPTDAASVIADALLQDGIIMVTHLPATEELAFQRCRLFTATEQAVRFALAHHQPVIHNLNRSCEVLVPVERLHEQ